MVLRVLKRTLNIEGNQKKKNQSADTYLTNPKIFKALHPSPHPHHQKQQQQQNKTKETKIAAVAAATATLSPSPPLPPPPPKPNNPRSQTYLSNSAVAQVHQSPQAESGRQGVDSSHDSPGEDVVMEPDGGGHAVVHG